MKNRTGKLLSLILAMAMTITSFSFSFAEDVIIEEAASVESATPSTELEGIGSAAITVHDAVLSGDINALKATLSWDAVEAKEGLTTLYAVKLWTGAHEFDDPASEGKIDAKGLTALNYLADVALNKTYNYQVGFAYDNGVDPVVYDYSSRKDFNTNFDATELSAPLTVKFKNAAGTFGEQAQTDDWIVSSWGTKNSVFDKYELYRGATKIADVTDKTTYTNKKVPAGTYTYAIRAYFKGTNVYQSFTSGSITVKAHLTGTVKTNIPWSAVTKKKNVKIYKKGSGSKYYFKVKKGTKLTATGGKYPKKIEFWGKPTRVQVKYKGKTGWVKWSDVKVKYSIVKKKDYSISTKEDFVNSNNLSSSSKYLIWVNRYTQRVNVFTGKKNNWKLAKTFVCCTGNYYQPTHGGTKYLKGHKSMVTKVHKNGRLYYFRYSTSFGGSGTFHTRCKWTSNNKWRNAIKQHPTTKGCVRLFDGPAKYVYGLPLKTTAYIK